MIDRVLKDRIVEHFTSNGYQVVPTEVTFDIDKMPDFVFTNGTETIYVVVLASYSHGERNALLEVMMRCVASIGKADRIYLLLPKLYATILDLDLLRRYGLGLVSYDQRGGIERLQAASLIQTETRIFAAVMRELQQLGGLEEKLEVISRSLEELRFRFDQLSRQISDRPLSVEQVTKRPNLVTTPQEIPPFLQDNPWINVLSKRRETGRVIDFG